MKKDIAVTIEGIGKKYVIGDTERYLSLRDNIVKAIKLPINILKGKKFKQKKEFWALKDISFEVERGDVVGIIGRNGAGKSTLLKILSRITEPTEGYIRYRGKVSSLLEVGTGFHPELTGRENVYLNGAILGMSRKEIDKKFNEIVEFSGVKEFIDMPVKRYSSGMQVRLAFSVAANLDSDILVIDEVLAVGDAEFQKKCLRKMDEVTKDINRTIFFVSHDMGAIRRICNKVVVMDHGTLVNFGQTDKMIHEYLLGRQAKHSYSFDDFGRDVDIKSIEILNSDLKHYSVIKNSNPFYIDIRYRVNNSNIGYYLTLIFYNENGVRLFTTSSKDNGLRLNTKPGEYTIRTFITNGNGIVLNPMQYNIQLHVGTPKSKSLYVIDDVSITISDDLKNRSENQIIRASDSILLKSDWKHV